MHQVCLRRGSNPGRLCHRRALYLKSYLDRSDRSGLFIPGPDFLPIPDPGSRGQKGTGFWIRYTGSDVVFFDINIPVRILERIYRTCFLAVPEIYL
jgi:hypothetical protein